ncbi:Aste57867_21351 [Aphanomyces stellatus]|uniref:Aste57867_21351 protein n=1 Tax=Aphanomyces stellatus TaxID=120398 RepID=A0A485LHC2_9STRA|nr:hypothetical protein As57867_021282 [Aphanomyces stellatus]VFT98023.1 Aste57867_21351 [Aphanomyces stellatus]
MLRVLRQAGRRRPSSLPRRQMGTVVSYYDSQSGQHVTYTDAIHVHGILHQVPAAPSDVGYGHFNGIAGLDSLAVSNASWFTPSLQDCLIDTSKHVYVACSQDGPLAIDLPINGLRETWDPILARCAAASKRGLPIKATLKNAFASSDVTIQLAGSLLADAGASIITLDDVEDLADEDTLLEAYEALTWCDVVGLPMKQRVGFRPASDATFLEELLNQAAVELEIKHFDVCVYGKEGPAAEDLVGVLDAAGLAHGLHLKDAAGGGKFACGDA